MIKSIFIVLILINFISSCSFPQSRVNVLFRIDDFGYDNEKYYPILFDIFEKHKIKLNVGVVPFKEVNGQIAALTENQIAILKDGLDKDVIEISQHGYAHLNNSNINDFSEFFGMKYSKQLQLIESGKSYLQKTFNINITTFIPPWNSYDSNSVRALENSGFRNLSAATYGNIQAVPSSLNYIPYTALLSDMDKIKSTLKKLSYLNNDKTYLVVILMHMYNFGEYESSNIQGYIAQGKISFTQFETYISEINKIDNVKFITFNELSYSNNDLDSNRLESNMYFKDVIPVFWLSNFRNIYYLEAKEINLNKYFRIIYQTLFYPLLFLVFIIILNQIITKMKGLYIDSMKKASYFFLIFSILIIITIFVFNFFQPKFLVLTTFLLSSSYSLSRAKKYLF